MTNRNDRRAVDQVLVLLGSIVSLAFLVLGGLAWYGYTFATTMVKDELAAQKIYFPEKGSAGFSEEEYPTLQQYAGQLVDDGIKAKAYANEYIGYHLHKIAEGKTYAEVSALAKKDPNNQQLAAQKATLFQGETLRGMLLGNGYAFWVFGSIAKYAALGFFAGAAILFVLVVLGVQLRLKN